MTDETANLVLELLRGMRADIAAIGKRLDGIDERLDAIETRLEGWRSVFVDTAGSLIIGMKAPKTRIAVQEGIPA